MADEITIVAGLKATLGSFVVERANLTKTATLVTSPPQRSLNLQSIGTGVAGTALVVATGVSVAGGCAFFKNTMSTNTGNYVEIGVQVTGAFFPVARLQPGEGTSFRAASLSLYGRAVSGSVVLEHDFLSP